MESENVDEKEEKPEAPDGGWGWFICVGYSLIVLTLRTIDSSFGLIFKDLLLDLKTSSTTASVIISCSDACYNFSGISVGPLLKKFSCRKVAVFGGVIASIGLMLTAFAKSVPHIIITYSIMMGVGAGLAIPSSFIVLNTYFHKKRGVAVAFSTAGSSLASMIIPQLANVFLELYGFSGTVLVFGALAMHSIVGACLMKPLRPKRKNQHSKNLPIQVIEVDNQVIKDIEKLDTRPDKTTNDNQVTSIGKILTNLFPVSLLRNFSFLNVIFGIALFNVAEVNFKLMTPFFLRITVGLNEADIALCLSLMSFADILSRIVLSIISDRFEITNRRMFWIASLSTAIARSIMAEQSEGIGLMITIVINGFLRGAASQNVFLSVSETCSLESLPSALGFLMVARGTSTLLFSPLIGYLRDYSGSYKFTFHVTSALTLIGFISWGIEFSCRSIRQRKQGSLKPKPLQLP